MITCLILFSGGLDSSLAFKILEKQKKLKLLGLIFRSYFFNEEKAKKIAESINLPIKIVDIGREHLEIVKSPKHGYGSGINPCLDCKILMLKKAKEILKKTKGKVFVATGEVLNQRPMSQMRPALALIEKESGLSGFLLRPLSALLLEETTPEKEEWIQREKLLDISGRSRKRQLVLAKEFGLKSYLTPAGGCILTEKEFAKKAKELFEVCPDCRANDVELLKIGRHFWLSKTKIVVGRNEEENLKLKKLARPGDCLIELKDFAGPLTMIRNYGPEKELKQEAIEKAKELTQFYSTKARGKRGIKFTCFK